MCGKNPVLDWDVFKCFPEAYVKRRICTEVTVTFRTNESLEMGNEKNIISGIDIRLQIVQPKVHIFRLYVQQIHIFPLLKEEK